MCEFHGAFIPTHSSQSVSHSTIQPDMQETLWGWVGVYNARPCDYIVVLVHCCQSSTRATNGYSRSFLRSFVSQPDRNGGVRDSSSCVVGGGWWCGKYVSSSKEAKRKLSGIVSGEGGFVKEWKVHGIILHDTGHTAMVVIYSRLLSSLSWLLVLVSKYNITSLIFSHYSPQCNYLLLPLPYGEETQST